MKLSTINNKERVERILYGVLSFAILLTIWFVATKLSFEARFPGPEAVLSKFWDSLFNPIGKFTLIQHIGWSLSRVFVGYTVSGICGISLGLMMGRSDYFRGFFMPLFNILRPIPPIAWTPLAILWFGVEEIPKYFLIFIAGMVVFTLNTYAGVIKVDKTLVGVARMLGASERDVFRKVVIPSSVPYIFSGAQIGISSCWMAVLGAEMLKSTEGAGWVIIMGSENGNYPQMLAAMLMIAIVGFVLAGIMRIVEGGLLKWNDQGN
jgi:ABC-type nitrate/sulfonate/bicarbonate transport system permease component